MRESDGREERYAKMMEIYEFLAAGVSVGCVDDSAS